MALRWSNLLMVHDFPFWNEIISSAYDLFLRAGNEFIQDHKIIWRINFFFFLISGVSQWIISFPAIVNIVVLLFCKGENEKKKCQFVLLLSLLKSKWFPWYKIW